MKVKKILFAVLLICCSFLMVNAKENDVFKYDWTKKYEYEDSWQLYDHNKVYYDGGLITTDVFGDEPTTKIVQYDSKGNVVKEKILEDIDIIYLEVHDKDIYVVGYTSNKEALVAKMNFDFEIEKEYLDEKDVIYFGFYHYDKDMYPYFFAVEDDKVFVYCNSGVLILDSNFKDASFKSFEDFTEKEYLEFAELFSLPYERYEELYDEDYYIGYFDMEDDIEAFFLYKDSKLYLKVYKDDKELYTKKLSSRIYYNNNIQSFRIVNNYVLIMTLDEILVYDLNGNKVQTIYIDDALEVADIKEDENYYYRFYNLVPGNNSFMYSICETSYIIVREQSRFECLNGPSGANLDTLEMTDSQLDTRVDQEIYVNIYDQVWYLPINVITKTDGNGQVEAIDTARYGDVVTFKVTPNKGYILDSVKVTDSNGNVVVFTDYTFTVPSSDVTIEATFVPENPDTSVGLITLIILFIIASLALGIRIRSKHKVKDMI